MSLLFMDSFDHYATADIAEKWTQIFAIGGTAGAPAIGAYGRNSTNGLRHLCTGTTGTHNSPPLGITLVPSGAVMLYGAALKYTGFGNLNVTNTWAEGTTSCSNILVGVKHINNLICFARVNTDGTISVFRWASGAGNCVLLGTTTNSLQAGVFGYVEVKITISDSAGTVDVRINGTSGLSLTGQNTRGAGSVNEWTSLVVNSVTQAGGGSATGVDTDDLVVMDGAGSFNNAFIGDVTVGVLYPSGAGTTTDWAPSTGSNYQCVDEAQVNDDTDYVSSSTLNAKDTYAFANAPAGADIRAVQIVSAQRKGAEGLGKIKHVVRSNGSDYDQAEQGIGGTSYAFLRSILETDPGSGSPLAAWTESGFNAAEFGMKKTG